MYRNKILSEALTYDDVLILPNYSEILPKDVEISTRLTRDINIKIPILSAAMDTVTEASMAQAIARAGGFGVIHKNLSIERQAEQVDLVKRSESGMITKPVTLSVDRLVGDAIALMTKFRISGIPITDGAGKLIGIVTNRDLRFNPDLKEKILNVMTKENLVTAPIGTTLEDAERILQNHRIEKLLVVDDNYNLKGLITFKDIQKKKQFPNSAKDSGGRLLCGAAIGPSSNTIERAEALVAAGVDVLFIDTAHGHSLGVINTLKEVKKLFPYIQIVAGNIGTGAAAEALIKAGADAVKVGIGPGSICTTRIIAGIGIPQLSAVMDVADVASKYEIPVIADGGIKQTGDISKALAGGADSVMIAGRS